MIGPPTPLAERREMLASAYKRLAEEGLFMGLTWEKLQGAYDAANALNDRRRGRATRRLAQRTLGLVDWILLESYATEQRMKDGSDNWREVLGGGA